MGGRLEAWGPSLAASPSSTTSSSNVTLTRLNLSEPRALAETRQGCEDQADRSGEARWTEK